MALIEALGAERAILVGHDWGAVAVYAAATLAPERVEKVVAIGIPHPSMLPRRLRSLWVARHFLTLKMPFAAWGMRRQDFEQVRTLYRRWSPTWDMPESDLHPIREVFSTPGSLDAALGYYRQLPLTTTYPVFRGTSINAPTLAVAGLDDPALTLDDYRQAKRRFTGMYDVCGLRSSICFVATPSHPPSHAWKAGDPSRFFTFSGRWFRR